MKNPALKDNLKTLGLKSPLPIASRIEYMKRKAVKKLAKLETERETAQVFIVVS